jgi:hypothetical protein
MVVEAGVVQLAGLHIRHESGKGCGLGRLEDEARFSHGHGDLLRVPEKHAQPRTAHVDGEAREALLHPAAYVVGLHFFGAPSRDPCDAVILHGVAHDVLELLEKAVKLHRLDGSHGTDLLAYADIALGAPDWST